MGVFFVYIFKAAFCLVLFYLFFWLLLSRETFHRFNRIALLGMLCLSWMLPWIEITTKEQVEVNQVVLTVEQLLMMAEDASPMIITDTAVPETSSISWIQILLLIYMIGVLFFVCRSIYSLGCLIRLLFSGKREKLGEGITLVIHDRTIAPFSWMKFIVISRDDLRDNGREILMHEIAHVRNLHSVDLLIADICIFFQWFNPCAWLLKQELRNVHEYEADETVIKEGIDAKEYQLLLIKKAVGTRLYSMANSFNHSKLKERITMMLKEKSNPWARLKYLYVLPLAAVAVTAFARPEVSETVEEISVVKVNDLATIVEVKATEITDKIAITELTDSLLPNSNQKRKSIIYSTDSLLISKDSCILMGHSKIETDREKMKSTVVINEKTSINTEVENPHFYIRKTQAKIKPKKDNQSAMELVSQGGITVYMAVDSVKNELENKYIYFINDKEIKGVKKLTVKGAYGKVSVDEKNGKQIVRMYTDKPEDVKIE